MPLPTPVVVVNRRGRTVARYPSQLAAARGTKCSQRTVCYCLASGIRFNGLRLLYANKPSPPERERGRRQPTTVRVGRKTYPSIRQASKGVGVSVATMWDRVTRDPSAYGVAV